jgi:hypothetical protein
MIIHAKPKIAPIKGAGCDRLHNAIGVPTPVLGVAARQSGGETKAVSAKQNLA